MGYALAMGHCLVCRQVFSFNPVKVPSFRVDGTKEPVCRECIKQANELRIKNGVEPFIIPADAYEACEEGELE